MPQAEHPETNAPKKDPIANAPDSFELTLEDNFNLYQSRAAFIPNNPDKPTSNTPSTIACPLPKFPETVAKSVKYNIKAANNKPATIVTT